MLRGEPVAAVSGHRPAIGRFVKDSGGNARLELDAVAQAEPIGGVVQVGEDLGLGGVALGPLPFAREVILEAVLVLQAFDIAAGAGVAIPVPGAANTIAGFDYAGAHAELAQAVEHVQPCEARADDDGIELGGGGGTRFRQCLGCSHGGDPCWLIWGILASYGKARPTAGKGARICTGEKCNGNASPVARAGCDCNVLVATVPRKWPLHLLSRLQLSRR